MTLILSHCSMHSPSMLYAMHSSGQYKLHVILFMGYLLLLAGFCDRDEKRKRKQRTKVKWLEVEEKDWDKAEWKD